MKKKLLAMMLVGLIAGVSFADIQPNKAGGTSDNAPASAGGEQKKLMSVDFPDTPLSTVLDVLSIKTGRKFITDNELARRRITMNLKDVTGDEVVNALLDAYNLYYVRQSDTSNIYVVKPRPMNASVAPVTTVSKLFFLNYASTQDLEGVVKSKLTPNGNVVAEARSNTLLVNDIADNIEKIGALIKSLDVPALQVLLEAKIVDVKIQNDQSYGVNFKSISRTGSLATQAIYKQPFTGGAEGSQLTLSVLPGDYDVQATISALQTDSNARLLTNPRLLVMNNSEASIDIVDQLVYIERTVSTTETTYTANFKDVGIKLKVKPQISRDGTIVLKVSPENSYQTGSVTVGDYSIPLVNSTKSETTFILRDGETAVIGGLIRETDQVTENKVPILGDIPLIGLLFKDHDKTKVRSELTIFITARVMQ